MRAAWEDRANPVRFALERALELAAQGIPCFPCKADKRPACINGFKDATTDADALQTLWQASPGVLVGMPTGEPSGFYVLDVDSARHAEARDWLNRNESRLPPTRQHQTQSGGWHYLFQHQQGLRNTASRLAYGVDTRGDGGYIIWWPAHVAGQHHFAPAAALPDWIIAALNPSPQPVISYGPYVPSCGGAAPDKRVEGIIIAVASAREGERNSLTFWGANRIAGMIANRELDASEASNAIAALTEAARRTGLPLFEIRRTIASAMR